MRRDSERSGGVNELHLFAGAGGGILGGMLLGHSCVKALGNGQVPVVAARAFVELKRRLLKL